MKGSIDHRGYAILSAIAAVLFLAVAIAGKHVWDWRRILCLIAGFGNLGISIREFRRWKSSGPMPE